MVNPNPDHNHRLNGMARVLPSFGGRVWVGGEVDDAEFLSLTLFIPDRNSHSFCII